MQIWRNLELRSMAHLLVAAARDYKAPATRHVAAVPTPDATALPCAGRDDDLTREVCPGWLRMIVDNRNG